MSAVSKKVDWSDFWDRKAGQATDFQATGRSVMSEHDFRHSIDEVVRLLQFKPTDAVADIGCGTGLFCVALSGAVERIDGVDISPAMIERARQNAGHLANVRLSVGGFPSLDLPDDAYDKVLAYSVLQYLSDEAAIGEALQETARILRPGGAGLFACNPDPACRMAYLEVLTQKYSPADLSAAIELLDQTQWVSRERLVSHASQAGLEVEALPISERIWQHFYMFDLIVRKV